MIKKRISNPDQLSNAKPQANVLPIEKMKSTTEKKKKSIQENEIDEVEEVEEVVEEPLFQLWRIEQDMKNVNGIINSTDNKESQITVKDLNCLKEIIYCILSN